MNRGRSFFLFGSLVSVVQSTRSRFFVCWFVPRGQHFGHPLGLSLFVRSFNLARHSCLHSTLLNFHFAL